MRVILGHLARTSADPVPATVVPLIQDLLWAHARPSDVLEHVRVRPAAHGLDVYLFVSSPSEASAMARMRELLCRAEQPIARHGFSICPR
ncbi:hypothetical protein OHA37_21890 [Streptomyces sp. NBC_00335]|uniref:hypothetical protein n=1 Tax=unclassified Streptomyces TaxID=2593676 RepID=UPI002252EE71|nr:MULTISPECIES: hypothetical protein [unclassified Streptomyces]MCX5406514.1 hypothetical protein [Streptomyces sp. NBC_00086]